MKAVVKHLKGTFLAGIFIVIPFVLPTGGVQ
jgi:hypothetical protein